MEYSGIFSLSFKEYCEINNLKEAPEHMIHKWVKDVIYNYSKLAPTESVMSLFDIPKSKKKAIEYHEYKIHDRGYQINENKKTMSIFLELEITR